MEKIIYLEILNRRDRVTNRIKLTQFPATVGRAYTNDVIIDDPFISPNHVQINLTPEGSFTLRDLDTQNGTYIRKTHERIQEHAPAHNTSYRIGQTNIRFRTPDYPVPPTQESQETFGGWRQKINTIRAALLSFFALYALTLLESIFIAEYKELNAAKTGIMAIGLFFVQTILFSIYAGIFSAFSRQNLGRYYFWGHITRICLGLLIIDLFSTITQILAYALALEHLLKYLLFPGVLAMVFYILYENIRLCTRVAPRKLSFIIGTGGIVTMTILSLLIYWHSKNFTPYPSFSAALYPPAFRWTKGSALDDYLDRLPRVQKTADTLAQEK